MELLFGVIGRERGSPTGWNENIIGKSVRVEGGWRSWVVVGKPGRGQRLQKKIYRVGAQLT